MAAAAKSIKAAHRSTRQCSAAGPHHARRLGLSRRHSLRPPADQLVHGGQRVDLHSGIMAAMHWKQGPCICSLLISSALICTAGCGSLPTQFASTAGISAESRCRAVTGISGTEACPGSCSRGVPRSVQPRARSRGGPRCAEGADGSHLVKQPLPPLLVQFGRVVKGGGHLSRLGMGRAAQYELRVVRQGGERSNTHSEVGRRCLRVAEAICGATQFERQPSRTPDRMFDPLACGVRTRQMTPPTRAGSRCL